MHEYYVLDILLIRSLSSFRQYFCKISVKQAFCEYLAKEPGDLCQKMMYILLINNYLLRL